MTLKQQHNEQWHGDNNVTAEGRWEHQETEAKVAIMTFMWLSMSAAPPLEELRR